MLAEETLSTRRTYLLAGVRDATPILVGILPFSMITGVAAVSVGLPKMEALALSMTNVRLWAGLLAALVAWRTKNFLLTLAVGMAALWMLQALL